MACASLYDGISFFRFSVCLSVIKLSTHEVSSLPETSLATVASEPSLQLRIYNIIVAGLAIALTMILVLVYYIKLAPVYPEPDRDRTLVFKRIAIAQPGNGNYFSGSLS